jgi:hypothetical protein
LARFPHRHSPSCEHSRTIAVPERQEGFIQNEDFLTMAVFLPKNEPVDLMGA